MPDSSPESRVLGSAVSERWDLPEDRAEWSDDVRVPPRLRRSAVREERMDDSVYGTGDSGQR